MKLKAARDGMREPLLVTAGNYSTMDEVCLRWDGVK
jgi:hypothetical protein